MGSALRRCHLMKFLRCVLPAAAILAFPILHPVANEDMNSQTRGDRKLDVEKIALKDSKQPQKEVTNLLSKPEWGVSIETMKAALTFLETNSGVMAEKEDLLWQEAELRDDVLIAIGNRHVRRREYKLARQMFQQVIRRFPGSCRRFVISSRMVAGAGSKDPDDPLVKETMFNDYAWRHRNSSLMSATVRIAQSYLCEERIEKAIEVLQQLCTRLTKEKAWTEDDLDKRCRGTKAPILLRNRPDKVALHILFLAAMKRGNTSDAKEVIHLMKERFPRNCRELATRLEVLLRGDRKAIQKEFEKIRVCPSREVWYSIDVDTTVLEGKQILEL
jgi:tetratricopeptide (TPR) repeat protein